MSANKEDSSDDEISAAFRALGWLEREVAAIQAGLDDVEAFRVKSLDDFDRQFCQERNIPFDL